MTNCGVIIGRFQVHKLHEGHHKILNLVGERNDHVIVFLGCIAKGITTKHDPLDFETRKVMLESAYPEYTILPLYDQKHNTLWSDILDKTLDSTVTQEEVTLYGSRDSFIPFYTGKYKTQFLPEVEVPNCSGTLVRTNISKQIMKTADFRAGVIYGMMNGYTRVNPTVDIAIARYVDWTADNPSCLEILMGRKPGETTLRFIGGFAETTGNYEEDAIREAKEETGLDVSRLEYMGSAVIDDWRLRSTPEAIKTVFYLGWGTVGQEAKASDDIASVEWIGYDLITPEIVEDTHHVLLPLLRKHADATLVEKYLSTKKEF